MYRFVRTKANDLKNAILKMNGISENQLDIKAFAPDLSQEPFLMFKEKLLELKDKRFLIVGDYDCDGICATAIMRRLLEFLKIRVNHYIPSRTREGYGINNNIVTMAKENGFDVILMVDNGIVANDVLSYAKDLSITTMIIDHHEYQHLPECNYVLHPSLLKNGYRDLCAGGLCAYLSMLFYADDYSLVLGGLATLADMVRVFDANRYLLVKMLEILNHGEIYQINLLADSVKYSYDTLSFKVIPKINAISRMGNMANVNLVVRYLLSSKEEASRTFAYINDINSRRKQLSEKMSLEAMELLDDSKAILLVRSTSFHEGLCGLVANRLLSKFNRPIIVLAENDGVLKGSGRSPAGFDLYECLSHFKDDYLSFGGHANAVGLSFETSFYEKFATYLAETDVSYLDIDKDVLLVDDLEVSVLETLEDLRPFGTGFPEPLFALDKSLSTSFFMIKGLYPKFSFGNSLSAICFDKGKCKDDWQYLIGKLSKDSYRKSALSLNIEDFI